MGSCTYPIAMGHVLSTSDVRLLQYVKLFNDDDKNTASNRMKNIPIPKDLNAFSSHQNILKNTSSQSSSADNTENNNDTIRKQNMSLPPHWRTEQPVRHHDRNGEFQSTIGNTGIKRLEQKDVINELPCGVINRKILSLSEEIVEHYQHLDMD